MIFPFVPASGTCTLCKGRFLLSPPFRTDHSPASTSRAKTLTSFPKTAPRLVFFFPLLRHLSALCPERRPFSTSQRRPLSSSQLWAPPRPTYSFFSHVRPNRPRTDRKLPIDLEPGLFYLMGGSPFFARLGAVLLAALAFSFIVLFCAFCAAHYVSSFRPPLSSAWETAAFLPPSLRQFLVPLCFKRTFHFLLWSRTGEWAVGSLGPHSRAPLNLFPPR